MSVYELLYMAMIAPAIFVAYCAYMYAEPESDGFWQFFCALWTGALWPLSLMVLLLLLLFFVAWRASEWVRCKLLRKGGE